MICAFCLRCSYSWISKDESSFPYLTRCFAFNFPSLLLHFIYFSDLEGAFELAIKAVERKLRDPQVAYIIEAQNKPSSGGPEPVILHGVELDLQAEELPENAVVLETDEDFLLRSRACSYFFSATKDNTSFNSVEGVISFRDIEFTNDLESLMNLTVYEQLFIFFFVA